MSACHHLRLPVLDLLSLFMHFVFVIELQEFEVYALGACWTQLVLFDAYFVASTAHADPLPLAAY